MSATFTPGPWRQCGADKVSRGCTCRIVWSVPADANIATGFNHGAVIACVHGEWGDGPDLVYGEIPEEQVAANARLIAAAPDLLAALEAVIANATKSPQTDADRLIDIVNLARAAIAKAGAA